MRMHLETPLALLVTAISLLSGGNSRAHDWPTLLGPMRDNSSPEKGILTQWKSTGLKKVWECSLGVGYAPPVVSSGKLYHFDRVGDQCELTCREAATGKVIWKQGYPTDYRDFYGYEPGPRACPVVDGDRVYTYGPDGMLFCRAVEDGKELWQCNVKAKYHFHQNFFGVGSVPVVEGDLLIVAVGGSPAGMRPSDLRDAKPDGTGIVAFDKKTGVVKYQVGDELASYSSPVVATIDGKRTGLYFARGGLLAFDPLSGALGFQFKWRAKIEESVNAANPVVVGNRILVSECYGPGSACIELSGGKLKEIWTDVAKDRLDQSLRCHWNTPIHHEGFLYGCSGRHDTEADLRCIDFQTGELKWKERRTTRMTLLKVDGHFLGLAEFGDLILFKIDATKYVEVARYRVPELVYPCWAPPVLCDGLLYLRGKQHLLCLELIPKAK